MVRHAAQLAEDAGLHGSDAVHLAAALVVPVEAFASGDVGLASAASHLGLHVLRPG
jgi:hypothetical protein